VSKVVQQLPCRIEALQWGKVLLKQPLREMWRPSLWIDIHLLEMKIEANYGVKRWPSVKSKDDPMSSQKMTQYQVKTKVWLVKPKDLDYP
jgi:hypothetical protein